MNQRMKQGIIETSVPFVISSILFVILFYRDTIAALDMRASNIVLLFLMVAAVLYTDYKIFVHINEIRQRKNGLKYLLVVGIMVVMFQVYFDLFKNDFDNNFYFLVFDFMYNLSFCALFIVAFKFTDIYYFKFYDEITD